MLTPFLVDAGPGVGLLGHKTVLRSITGPTSVLLSVVAALIYIPTNSD